MLLQSPDLEELDYFSTTDILCSTFSFDSVKIFSHIYRPPPPPPPPLYHRYELNVRGGVVMGGGVCDRNTPPTTTPPLTFKFKC